MFFIPLVQFQSQPLGSFVLQQLVNYQIILVTVLVLLKAVVGTVRKQIIFGFIQNNNSLLIVTLHRVTSIVFLFGTDVDSAD